MHEWLSVAVVLLGYTVLGLTGFGSALVIVPLLAWQWPLPEVVALVLVLDLPASLMHSGLNWRLVQWGELRRLLPGMAAGTLAGLWLPTTCKAAGLCWRWVCMWLVWACVPCARGRPMRQCMSAGA